MTNSPPPNKPGNWARISKTLAFWALVILVPVLFLQYSAARTDSATKIDYTDFDNQVTAGNVKSVVITAGKDVVGEFKTPQPIGGRQVSKFNVKLYGQINEHDLAALKAQNVHISNEDARPSIGLLLINWLPIFLIVAIWLFIYRQMQAGGAKAFSFGKSKAKLLAGDTPKVTFADVAGADEAKVELEEIIEFLKDPQKFTKLGGRLPKGALLVGPPGTGKTLQ